MMADGLCKENPSRRVRMKPQNDAEKHIRLKADKAGLRQVYVNSYKGRGVFALKPFSKGDFVLEYRGKLHSPDNPPVIETYSETESTYLFDFQWKGKSWCIDASLEDQSLGRLVNDEHKTPNCKVRQIQVDGMPHLCLFAIRDILPGEEITYNYGESDWPWHKQLQLSTSSVATPSPGDHSDTSHQSLVPAEHVEHSSSIVNMSFERYMASEEERNEIERHRTSLLCQRELLDQQLAQLDNVSTTPPSTTKFSESSNPAVNKCNPRLKSGKRQSKEDTSDESMDESSCTDYSDVDYVPDTDGVDSDVSMSLSPEKPRQRVRCPQLANNPDKESSSTDSPDKESSTKRNIASKKMGSSFIPEKKKKWTFSPQKRRNDCHPEKDSSSILSPEKDKSSIKVQSTTSTQGRRV